MTMFLLALLLSAAPDAGSEQVLQLTGYTRIGTMPGGQDAGDAYWASNDEVCVVQGTSKSVRCWSPSRKRWSRAVPTASKPAIVHRIGFEARRGAHGGWVERSLGPEWPAVIEQEDARCVGAAPTLAEQEAKACADPNSVECAQWARYAPAATSCSETVEAVRFSPDERAALIALRVTDSVGSDNLVLFVATTKR